jgi:predicted metalloprotease with PDZ domain
MKYLGTLFVLIFSYSAMSQNLPINWTDALGNRYDHSKPFIHYRLTVDTSDLTSFSIEMEIRNAPDTFQVAMASHPEYDDKYWHFIRHLKARTKSGTGTIIPKDSALWQVTAIGGEVVLEYSIQLPPARPARRLAWRPFLSPTGGLVGGIHSFMYVVGQTLSPAHVEFNIPEDWGIATGLVPTANSRIFFAPSAFVLMDCPALIGRLNIWPFTVQGVPHRVVYWQLPESSKINPELLVTQIQKIVQEAALLFGKLPYREYSFLFQDNALGSLEHNNSVTMGIPAMDLEANPSRYLGSISHEYFHTWNMIRLHPAEYGDLDNHPPPLSKGLWWSEGLTMFYADLLLRRAGLNETGSSRVRHFEDLMERYYQNPGNYTFSAEIVSQSAYAPNGNLGDYSPSTHLQGEILGALIDLIIRDKTNGSHSIDDVMKVMMEKYSGKQGFNGRDIERVVSGICHCNIRPFFDNYVRGHKPIDFNLYLGLVGLQADTSWRIATGKDGKPAPDLRVYGWQKPEEPFVRIGISQPAGNWGVAGLHTGDIIIELNGVPIPTTAIFRQELNKIKPGDRAQALMQSPRGNREIIIPITSYQEPRVSISELSKMSLKQRKLNSQWVSAK